MTAETIKQRETRLALKITAYWKGLGVEPPALSIETTSYYRSPHALDKQRICYLKSDMVNGLPPSISEDEIERIDSDYKRV